VQGRQGIEGTGRLSSRCLSVRWIFPTTSNSVRRYHGLWGVINRAYGFLFLLLAIKQFWSHGWKVFFSTQLFNHTQQSVRTAQTLNIALPALTVFATPA